MRPRSAREVKGSSKSLSRPRNPAQGLAFALLRIASEAGARGRSATAPASSTASPSPMALRLRLTELSTPSWAAARLLPAVLPPARLRGEAHGEGSRAARPS